MALKGGGGLAAPVPFVTPPQVAAVTSPALLCPQGPAGGSKDDCATNLFTASGECCRACNVGEGVVQPCGVNQTVCEPCLDSVTFSDTVSATEPCRPCTQCGGLQSMSAPCVESDDAVCVCTYGYFQDERSGSCRQCRVCEVGFGLMFSCKGSQDTVCEECPPGTFSSEANFVDPCLPCSSCEENEVLVRECTATADAECRAPKPDGSPYAALPASKQEEVAKLLGSSAQDSWRQLAGELGYQEELIASFTRDTPGHTGMDRNTLGMDSDTPEMDRHTPGMDTPKPDGSPYAALPASKQEEVAKLLGSSAQDSWRQLAGELGYQEELIASFTREESPARALLSHWGRRDSATLEALVAALRRAQRGDIA
ncbi:PREDICTED: tumor necrosis factor receptor superfamily member 16, partial [Ficedula albicollis]|uniref:tumor necrosis factor receptor superfamily member 16 n=1 Tax=Ficedula albicollis TaxID=59894 RepID=UPI0007AD8873